MKRNRQQQGLTFIGFLLLLSLIGFFVLLILKIGPIYLEHYKVKSSLESLVHDPELPGKSREQIIDLLERRWEINMVENATAKNVKVLRQGNRLRIQIVYEVIRNVMGNLDVRVRFDEAVEVPLS